ncbi:MAG: 50S ribosomal protein L22 [Muribaculaceae bacterium]
MGVRKRLSADKMKEERKSVAFAKLTNVPSSPRKMRLVADMIRGKEVFRAIGLLKFSNKDAAAQLSKLLRSAIANWEQKNEKKAENGELYISTIYVNCAPMLKRLRTAPQGRGYRIRKRANHVTLVVDTIDNNAKTTEA